MLSCAPFVLVLEAYLEHRIGAPGYRRSPPKLGRIEQSARADSQVHPEMPNVTGKTWEDHMERFKVSHPGNIR